MKKLLNEQIARRGRGKRKGFRAYFSFESLIPQETLVSRAFEVARSSSGADNIGYAFHTRKGIAVWGMQTWWPDRKRRRQRGAHVHRFEGIEIDREIETEKKVEGRGESTLQRAFPISEAFKSDVDLWAFPK